VAVSLAYFVQAYQRFGLQEDVIGTIVSIATATAFISQPLWGRLVDTYNRPREIVIFGCSTSCILYFLMVYSGGRVWAIALLSVGIYLFFTTMMFLIDGWVSKLIVENYQINYGATRACGSVMYAVTAVIFGVLVVKGGMIVAPITFTAFCVLLVIVTIGIPNPNPTIAKPVEKTEKQSGGFLKGFAVLAKNRVYVVFLIAVFFNAFCYTASDTFYSVKMFDLGGNESNVGLGLFIQAMSELPFMIFFTRIHKKIKLPLNVFIAISMFFYFAKCLFLSLAGSVFMATFTGVFHGLAFGMYQPAMIAYAIEILDSDNLATGQMILASLGGSLGGIIASPICGQLSVNLGTDAMMQIMSGFALLSAAIMLVAPRLAKKKNA